MVHCVVAQQQITFKRWGCWHQKCLLGCTRLIKSRLTALNARSHCDGNGNGFVGTLFIQVYFYDNGIVAAMNGFSANI